MTKFELKSKRVKNYLLSCIIIIISILSFSSYSDRVAIAYVNNSLTRALAAYAIVRGLNSAISLVQSTEIAVQPAGVGVSINPGEVLDPINDLVEWISNVILSSIAAIGFQKLLLEIIAFNTVRYVFTFILITLVIIKIFYKNIFSEKLIKQLLILLIFLRFGFPVIALINEYVFKTIISQRYETSIKQVEQLNSNLSKISIENNFDKSVDTTWYNKFFNQVLEAGGHLDVRNNISSIKQIFSKTGKELTDLAVIFIFDAIVLPLIFFMTLGLIIRRT